MHSGGCIRNCLFAADGSKLNFPRELRASGHPLLSDTSLYPQGLLSCLCQLKSQMPFDFDLVVHGNERRCAMGRLDSLAKDDIVVYDRSYFSYPLLYCHPQARDHAVFRLRESAPRLIQDFLASTQADGVVLLYPGPRAQADLRQHLPDLVPVPLRLLKYQIAGSTFCLGTTLVDPFDPIPSGIPAPRRRRTHPSPASHPYTLQPESARQFLKRTASDP